MFYATGLPGWLRGGPGLSGALDQRSEKDLLSEQATALQSELNEIQKRLGELEAGTAQESRVAP